MKTYVRRQFWHDIVLALIVVSAIAPVVSYDTGIRCITAPCPSSETVSFLFYALKSFPPIITINWLFFFQSLIIVVGVLIIATFTRRRTH